MADDTKVEQAPEAAPEVVAAAPVTDVETKVEKLEEIKTEVADVKGKIEKFEDEVKADVKKVEEKLEKIEEKVVEEVHAAEKWFLEKFKKDDAEAAVAAPVVVEEEAPAAPAEDETDAPAVPAEADKKEGE